MSSSEELHHLLSVACAGQAHEDESDPAYCANAITGTIALEVPEPGQKVMPPTFAGAQKGEARYLLENRRADSPSEGGLRDTVVLDTVGSQANRIELALLEAQRAGKIDLPVLSVDLGEPFGSVTALEVAHRCYDPYIWESEYQGEPFVDSLPGREIGVGQWRAPGHENDATGLLAWCPTALSLGGWDAHAGARTLRAARFARSLTCEITGSEPRVGDSGASHYDPFNVAKDVPTWRDAENRMTTDPEMGVKKGVPSNFGYGSIPTSGLGGVGIASAAQRVTLSLPALRRLRFPQGGEYDPEAERRARTAIGALSLHGVALLLDAGYDLRSGCLLIASQRPELRLVGRYADVSQAVSLEREATRACLEQSIAELREAGYAWHGGTIGLTATASQVALVRESAVIRRATPEESE